MHRRILRLQKKLVGVTRAPKSHATYSPAPNASHAVHASDAKALGDMLTVLASVVNELRTLRQAMIGNLAEMSVELGVAIAERLVGDAIAMNRQRLDQVVLDAMQRMHPNTAITIEAHPADIALLQSQVEASPALDTIRASLTFRPNPGRERGRVVVETGELFVEWDVRRCVSEMRAVLLDEVYMEP
ncbi:MAG: hypothetical protein HYR84_14525 [Planctomycetes bacterium]|nr:hypothetical protein [Planctomycetota bacterium]